jgi:hypothetical protein
LEYAFIDLEQQNSQNGSSSLLKSQIPVRVCFHRDEKKPGYFELDTVSHCGARAVGQFCQTLTVTDVGSGWTDVCALFFFPRLLIPLAYFPGKHLFFLHR